MMVTEIRTEMSAEKLARAYMAARREVEQLRERNQVLEYACDTWRNRVRGLEEDFGISEGNRWTS